MVILLAGGLVASRAMAERHVLPTTKPAVQEMIKPVLVVDEGQGKYFVDFGEDSFGALELVVEKPEAGRKVVVRMGEKLLGKEQIDPKPPQCVRFLQTTISLEADKKVYRAELPPRDAKRTTAEMGPVMPFRYVELENLPAEMGAEELRGGAVRQIMAHYVFDDDAAAFECADPKLNAIWKVCKHTMKATSFGGVFVDGDRERTPYEADAYINMLGWYCCTTDLTLPRYSHEKLMSYASWPTEWIMFSVLIAWEDYQHTGDLLSAKSYYPDLKAKTLRALERADGLISTVDPAVPVAVNNSVHFNPQAKLRDIVDWPPEYRDDYDMFPINTVINAFHYRSMVLMGKLAAALVNADDAADFERAAQKTAKSINEKLVDATTGLYVDGEGSKHSSLQGNLFPLAFGLVPAERREKVLAFIESRKMACNVYAAQFLMEGLFDNGRGDYALELITAPGERSWRHMVEDVGATMTLEAWRPNWRQVVDWNHAWGAAPANILPRKCWGWNCWKRVRRRCWYGRGRESWHGPKARSRR
jgi:hypothetical protein